MFDGVTGLSTNAAAAYTDLAAIVRFNTTNTIDAINGGGYQAVSTIPYTANTSYHFRLVINIPAHTYSVYVTPQGGSEITLGTTYAFRTEQATAGSLAYWNLSNVPGTHKVCNFAISTPDTTPPTTPGTPVASNITSNSLTLNWTASTDNIAVTGYRVERCTGSGCTTFSQIATPTTNSYNDTTLSPLTSYTYRVRSV